MSQYLGDISAYALAVSQGYTGTEEEYAELMASYATVGQTAVTAAQTATTKASEAATSATTATNKASEATTAATTATTKAAEAQADADAAALDASQALSAASTATTKASEATTAAATATSAKTDAVAANTAAQSAKTAAQTAQAGAETAAASVQSSAAQIQTNADDISELKEDFAQMESDGVVPSAEQILTDKGITDSVPYHYRKTGGDGADRLYDQIVGGTVCFNQLMALDDDSWTILSGNVSVSATNGKIVANGTSNVASTTTLFPARIYNKIKPIKGHRHLLSVVGKTGFNLGFYIYGSTTQTIGIGVLNGSVTKIFTGNVDTPTDGELVGTFSNGETVTADFCVYLVDLTAMFGPEIADYIYSLETAHAGDGVAFFKSLFPNDYYPYNAGELVSVSGLSAHKMTGFNQWDEEWEVGYINPQTGAEIVDSSKIRMKNYVRVLPNTAYYKKTPINFWNVYFDANKTCIGYGNSIEGIFTTPENCYYIRSGFETAYGTTYKNDICINISSSRNGEYEPYEEHSYPLDSDVTLRGIPKLDADNNLVYDGDVYESTGKVARKYGIVDLGTLTWTRSLFDSIYAFWANIPERKAWGETVIAKYYNNGGSVTSLDDKTFSGTGNTTYIYIRDDTYTDATAFKNSLSGVMLVYKLATPTTEQAQPYTNPQIVDDFGTEEYVTDSIVPVGHVTKYANNLRAKLEMAPNSPDGDGDYIVRQTNGLNEYVSLSSSEVIQNINEAISDNAEQIQENTDDIDQLKSDVVGPDYIVPEITGWIDGGYISKTDGEVVAYSSYHYTDYIEINPFLGAIKFTNSGGDFDVVYNAWYDENKAFIKSFSTKKNDSVVIQPPFNARYMRLSFNKTTTNTVSAEYIYGNVLENSIWNELSDYIRSKFLLGWTHNGDGSYDYSQTAPNRMTIITPLHFGFDISISVNSGYEIGAQFFDGYETGSSHLQSATGWLDNILIPNGSYFCITFRASDNSTLTNVSLENLSAVGYANNSDIYAKLMPMFDKYMGEPTVATDYLLNVGFDKKYCELSLLGSISGAQSFCIYNDKFYSTDGSNLYEQGSDLSLISTTALSLGHGNALQLGHNGKAYASGWNDNSVYVVDLENKEITDTITLPGTGYTTCAVDDISELIYIFHRASYPDTIATYTLTVYDYANDEIIRTSKIPRQFAAMQGCDFVDGKIFAMYGLGTSSAPNGYVIFDTNGNVLAEYIIASKSTLEPEGICVDRSTNDIYISYVNRNLYKINFV